VSLFIVRVALDDGGVLADVLDDLFETERASVRALANALSGLRAGSLGLFGPRGAGKTTLIRAATSGRLPGWQDREVLGVMVPAPVRYEAREFVPFLLGRLCLAVTRPVDQRVAAIVGRQRKYRSILRLAVPTAVGALLVMVIATIAAGASKAVYGFIAAYGVSVSAIVFGAWSLLRRPLRGLGIGDPLVAEARRHLHALRYLETTTEEWNAEVNAKAAKLGRKLARSFAARALTLPEITARYDDFVTEVVGNRRAVIIGIDELDKMATAEEAARFLNDIKALFGRKGVYYLVSLSEDAAASFEQRGAGVRDVFDSVFDDVLAVEPLKATESVSILKRRVIGMQPPFGEVCHVVSGGLPRELIRCARELAALADAAGNGEIGALTRSVLARRSLARQHAVAGIAARHVRVDGTQPVLVWLRSLGPQPSAEDLLLRSRIAPVLKDAHVDGQGVPELESALLRLAAWWYHAASVLEWLGALTPRKFASAQKLLKGHEGNALELLARGSLDLAVAPALAWETVSAFRRAVRLDPETYPLDRVDSGAGEDSVTPPTVAPDVEMAIAGQRNGDS
jgi:hypothetical protein